MRATLDEIEIARQRDLIAKMSAELTHITDPDDSYDTAWQEAMTEINDLQTEVERLKKAPSDDAAASAEQRKAMYAAADADDKVQQPLVPASCDFDHENDSLDGDTLQTQRRPAYLWQANEALRLATESKMIDAEDSEIDAHIIEAAIEATAAWSDLTARLKRRAPAAAYADAEAAA